MSAPQISSHLRRSPVANRKKSHQGFTLIELLVAMTIIGILVALLLPAVQSVRRSAWEGSIAMDMAQMDSAVEKFKDKYGIYPSDFSEFLEPDGTAKDYVDVSGQLLSMLQKISPVHNELAIEPLDGSISRLEYWWDNVGKSLATFSGGDTYFRRTRGPQVALWFWLSQLYNDAQYPLTGTRNPMVPLQVTSEKKVFYDFPANSLEVIDEVVYATATPNATSPDLGRYKIARVLQRRSEAPYVYFHHATYSVGGIDFDYDYDATSAAEFSENFAAAMTVRPDPDEDFGTIEFYKPSSFQIIGAGSTGLFGNFNLDTDGDRDSTDRIPHGADGEVYNECFDNLTNFSEGRLDAFLDNQTENVAN